MIHLHLIDDVTTVDLAQRLSPGIHYATRGAADPIGLLADIRNNLLDAIELSRPPEGWFPLNRDLGLGITYSADERRILRGAGFNIATVVAGALHLVGADFVDHTRDGTLHESIVDRNGITESFLTYIRGEMFPYTKASVVSLVNAPVMPVELPVAAQAMFRAIMAPKQQIGVYTPF